MKGKIDRYGFLYVVHGNQPKDQQCPYSVDSTQIDGNNTNTTTIFHRQCGDWCPLFGEPTAEEDYDFDTGTYKETGRTDLSLCKKHLTFDTFVDERPKEQS